MGLNIPRANKKGPRTMGTVKTQMGPLSKATAAQASRHGTVASNNAMVASATKGRGKAPKAGKARRGRMY